MDVDARLRDQVDLVLQHLLGQPVFRNAEGKHAARDGLGLVYVYFITDLDEIVAAGESRSAGADDGDFLSVLREDELCVERLRITSYNVCYTKLLRLFYASANRTVIWLRQAIYNLCKSKGEGDADEI